MSACVTCGHDATELLAAYCPSITSDRQIVDGEVENRICSRCATVFNAQGSRGGQGGFYAEQYDLHGESALSEWQVQSSGIHGTNVARRGENDAIFEFIQSNARLPGSGRMLEVGCGKGILLGRFLREYPAWSACAVEPSTHATAYFRRILPEVEIHEGSFDTAPFRDRKFDFAATSGVLEHVLDPVAFLREIRACLAPGAQAYVGVPNFAVKPDDLLVFDHLTRFTPHALDVLYAVVGLRLVQRDASDARVWLWDLVEACEPSEPRLEPEPVAQQRRLAEAHVAQVRASFAAYREMLERIDPLRDTGALFGLGVLGLLARHDNLEASAAIRHVLDDNPHLWGSVKHGLPVHGSQDVPELGIHAAFLSANPCYHARMRTRLESLGVPAERIFG